MHVDDDAPDRVPVVTERRPFSRAGFDVAPLAISGAFDLGQPALELRGRGWRRSVVLGASPTSSSPSSCAIALTDRVITGSYHADPRSIEADVDRALRKLRRTHLDDAAHCSGRVRPRA